ncbi:MAG: hypothetical protein ACD_21C00275G0002, partial [uncultured bacterium]
PAPSYTVIMIIENKHRLDLACYEGMMRASFTLCIKNRKPVFTNANIVEILLIFLKSLLENTRVLTGFTCLCPIIFILFWKEQG